MLQVLGSIMIFAGTLGIGYELIDKKRKIIHVIEKWEWILQLFVSEIIYKKQPLNFACMEIGEKVGGKERKLLLCVSKRMVETQRGQFQLIWIEECKKYCKGEDLESAQIELIMDLGVITGFEDEESQKRMMEAQKEKWKNVRIQKQEEFRERKRLILSLSPCIGLLIILVLW